MKNTSDCWEEFEEDYLLRVKEFGDWNINKNAYFVVIRENRRVLEAEKRISPNTEVMHFRPVSVADRVLQEPK
jgi:hypothetical protein